MSVTVAIKALNEAPKIEAAIVSALTAVEPVGGTVLLADSLSDDETIAIARRYPIRILQLTDPIDRGCGAGAQLAFQGIDSPFFYLMDGDMTLQPGFLRDALAWLELHPEHAGVAGQVIERVIANEEFQIRSAAMEAEDHRRAGDVDRLDGGGLYRRAAILDVGYFADRNLKSYEEFDLAARLRAKCWKLARLPLPAVEHRGHAIGGYKLLCRRFLSGQLGGAGAVLRAALHHGYADIVLRSLRQVSYAGVIWAWWLLVGLLTFVWPSMAGLLGILPIAFLGLRRRSLTLGLYSFVYWNAFALSFAFSFARRQVPPQGGVPSIELSPTPSFQPSRVRETIP